ncbi:YSIRK-type signal peptide-containing protein, partial [Streptococcus suis]|nr:YSIRK-type signal peptide-containing protein [Streptococcus suis]
MKFEKRKQRFSIRKYNFGAASVLLGTVIFAIASPKVYAEEIASNQSNVVQAVSENTNELLSNDGTDLQVSQSEATSNSVETTLATENTTDTKVIVEPVLEQINESSASFNTPTIELDNQVIVSDTVDTADLTNESLDETTSASNISDNSSTSNLRMATLASDSTTTEVEASFTRDKSATTNNSITSGNESGQYWPDTKGNSINNYENTTVVDLKTPVQFSDDYYLTPILKSGAADLSLYVNGVKTDIRSLPTDGTGGKPAAINVNSFGENTYFFAKNIFQIWNSTTQNYENYSLKWTIQSVNYPHSDATVAFGYRGTEGGGNPFLSLGSGYQITERGNYINTHLQYFKTVNDTLADKSVDEAIASGDIVAAPVKLHMGYQDIDANESIQLTESIVSKIYVTNLSGLAYQVTEDGFLAITRKYDDPSNVTDLNNDGKGVILFELNIPAEGYDFSITTIGNSGGELSAGSKIAPSLMPTIVYRQPLIINFFELDEDGNKTTQVLQNHREAMGQKGQKYTETADTSAPDQINDWYLVPDQTEGNPDGVYIEGTANIINYYYQRKGNVIVNYVDTSGVDLAGSAGDKNYQSGLVDTPLSFVGTNYNTSENRPERLVTADGKIYSYVQVRKASDSDASEEGVVKNGTTTVTYVYKLVTGDVLAQYVIKGTSDQLIGTTVEADGKAGNLAGTRVVADDAPVGDDYSANAPTKITTADGKVYNLVGNRENAGDAKPTGQVTEATQTVTYEYVLAKGDVVVNYVNEAGVAISGPETNNKTSVTVENQADTGKSYDTTKSYPQTITTADGTKYTYVKVQDGSASETGKVTEGTQTVTYVYRKVVVDETTSTTSGTVIVHYKDTAGNTIAPDETDTKDALVSTTVTKTEDGKIVSSETTPSGVKYDTSDDHKHSTLPGTDGKVYKLVETLTKGPESGTLKEGLTEVTYVYQLAKGDVVVNYVDESGNPISGAETGGNTSVKDMDQADTGTEYDTTDKRPDTITTADGTKYTYTKVQDGSASETGKVTEGTQTVTYVYRKVVAGETTTTTTGTVIVHYQDTEGNTIAGDETDTDKFVVSTTVTKTEDGKIVSSETTPSGAKYDTTDHKAEKLEKDGYTYVLVPSKTVGSESGNVVEGTTEVTYVYQKVAKWIPEIPGVPETDRPMTDYPFDPTQPDAEVPTIPTNPGTDQPVVPHVPGYTPVDPKDNTPLTPVDPEDPSKGYIPPVPENPGVDTKIPYVKDPVVEEITTTTTGSVIVHYQDTEGNTIAGDETDTDKVVVSTTVTKTEDGKIVSSETTPSGAKYDTADHKAEKLEKDGYTYVLVPSKTVGSESGNVVEGTTEVTYVY